MASCGEQEECRVVNGTSVCVSQTCPFKGISVIYKPWTRCVYIKYTPAVRNLFVSENNIDEVYMKPAGTTAT